MVADILIGHKRNNILWKLRKSKAAKLLLIFSWICLYKVFRARYEMHLEQFFIIGVLGLLLVNFLYVPVRMLKYLKMRTVVKVGFMIILGAMLVQCMRYSLDVSSVHIIWDMINGIIYVLGIILFAVALGIFCKVHAKKNRGFAEGCEVDAMDGHDFEYYCADLLRKRGFIRIEVTPGSGDYGVDIIAWKNGVKYGIQCKRYSGSVGWHAVEEAHAGAVYYHCDRAVVLTNNVFTKQAVNGAAKIGVLLWDRGWIEERI